MIRQPDGQPLTPFKRGPGPHTGVHLIFVRDDLGDDHPPAPAGRGGRDDPRDASPSPRPAATGSSSTSTRRSGQQPNFQLFRPAPRRGHRPRPQPLPPPAQVVESGGYRFAIQRHAEAEGDRGGVADRRRHRPARAAGARSRRDYGALAHAIFFRQRLARLLPHPRLRARRERLHEHARRRAGHRHLDEAGEADGRRARAGAGHLAPLPPDQGRRPRGDGPVHAATSD